MTENSFYETRDHWQQKVLYYWGEFISSWIVAILLSLSMILCLSSCESICCFPSIYAYATLNQAMVCSSSRTTPSVLPHLTYPEGKIHLPLPSIGRYTYRGHRLPAIPHFKILSRIWTSSISTKVRVPARRSNPLHRKNIVVPVAAIPSSVRLAK